MPDRCIKCGSTNISTTEPGTTEGNQASFTVECKDCGTRWIEFYKYAGYAEF